MRNISTPKKPSKIKILLVVWGDFYWNNFLTKNLSTRLTDNNFLFLQKHFDVEYEIYSTHEDWAKKQSNPILDDLSKRMNVKFKTFEFEKNKSKYGVFAKVHSQVLKECEDNTAFIFDFPDLIYSSTLFEQITHLILKGKRLIHIPGAGLNLQEIYKHPVFKQKIQNQVYYKDEDFLEVCLDCLHPNITLPCFKHNKYILNQLGKTYWEYGKNGFFMHGFHLHPIFVWPEVEFPLLCQTIDFGEYLYKACPNSKKHHFCSERVYYFELSDAKRRDHTQNLKPTALNFVFWSRQFAHPLQRRAFFQRKFFGVNPKSFCLSTEIRWFLFLFRFYFLSIIPTFFLKPFFYKTAKSNDPCFDLSFRKFLSRYFFINYFENLILHDSDSYDVDQQVQFINLNFRYFSYPVLKQLLQRLMGRSRKDALYFIENLKPSKNRTKLIKHLGVRYFTTAQ